MKNRVVAQIGCGYWGPNLMRAFSSLPDVRLKILCDMRPGRLDWARANFNGIETTADMNRIFQDPEIDAVIVATQPVTHHEIGRKVLMAGKNLFVEKPLAHTLKGALDLRAISRRRGLHIGVGHVYLYHPAVQALKAALNPQELGLVQYLDLARVNPGPPEPKHSVLWDLAPHEVSLAVDLAQKKPISVRATGMRWDHRVFEAANLEIKFSGGILARIHASWRGHLKVRRLDAYCEKGMASFDEMAPNQLKLVYPGQDNRIGAGDQFSGTLTYGEPRIDIPVLPSAKPLNAECADFISSLNKGHDPRSGADLGVCVVRILEAAERSAKLRGQEIRL